MNIPKDPIFCINCGDFINQIRTLSKKGSINFKCGNCHSEFNLILEEDKSGDYPIEITNFDPLKSVVDDPELKCPFSALGRKLDTSLDKSHGGYECLECGKLFQITFIP